jgi:hypothetical protein
MNRGVLFRKLPSIIKNPRKLKKAWKRAVISQLFGFAGRNGVNCRYRLRWVPCEGWCVTVFPKRWSRPNGALKVVEWLSISTRWTTGLTTIQTNDWGRARDTAEIVCD